MVEQLWAPWRLSYVTGDRPDGCVLCGKPDEPEDENSLVVERGRTCYVVLNLYPYNPGHVMVVPYRHVSDLTALTAAESTEAQELLSASLTVLRSCMGPHGFNVGLNLGSAAGAGIADHLHWHAVPRWTGDTNFMPILGDVRVMPQHMQSIYEQVATGFREHRLEHPPQEADET